MNSKITFLLFAVGLVAYVKAASLGDALVTVYADTGAVVPDADLIRDKRQPFFDDDDEDVGDLRHKHHSSHHHHHHHHHHKPEYVPVETHEVVHVKPSHCKKCSSGPVGGGGATFATSSAGTINQGGYDGHGGLGSQSVSQSAAYNFGPFSASFSASQSAANGGFGGFF